MGEVEKGLNRFTRRGSFIPAYSLSLMIWILASLRGDDLERVQRFPESPLLRIILSDPFMHFLVFGLLTLFICRGFYGESRRFVPLLKTAVLAVGYGFLIEVYQGILPWRSFGLDDILWNTLGVLFFLAVAQFVVGKKSGKWNPVLS